MIHNRTRQGSVIVIALWALGIAAIVTSSIQIFAQRQALLGIEVRDRIQARWAARAGVETSIAVIADHTAQPTPWDAYALITDLEYVATGEIGSSAWDIRYYSDGQDWAGPIDEHSKFNINSEDNAIFILVIDDMAFGVLDAILDWIDEDDEPRLLGVERDYYLNLETSYEPRNGHLRSIAELELIGGVMPDEVRGEDWNLNYKLDPNENDGGESLPWDEPDDYLEGGWASLLTTSSVDGGATESGNKRINLKKIDAESLQLQLGLEPAQANALIDFAKGGDADLATLLTQTLRSISGDAQGVTNLTDDQLRIIFAETSLFDAHEAPPGRMNINTIPPQLLHRLLPDNNRLVEEILYLRANNAGGITSPMDFLEIPGINTSMVSFLYGLFDTHSNVFTISCTGKANGSGVEQEIIAIVDRSTLPVTILEYREQ
ncbi:MAG: hypothetical protein HOC27_00595 [Phycisphaerae bacterium]|jgi:hypothetical protein|nr:hypothetical protein [Phycisphaerae bacterium]